MKRYFNSHFNREVVTIMPGELYVSGGDELISTLLGSCISVCLFDANTNIGGMNHFLLPHRSVAGKTVQDDLYDSSRYGVHAMETLILKMQLKGADRQNLMAKVFGGGNVLSIKNSSMSVGDRNIEFTREYLKTEKIPIVGEDTGGDFSRKVLLRSGDFSVQLNKTPVDSTITQDEEEYMKKLNRLKEGTQVIYF